MTKNWRQQLLVKLLFSVVFSRIKTHRAFLHFYNSFILSIHINNHRFNKKRKLSGNQYYSTPCVTTLPSIAYQRSHLLRPFVINYWNTHLEVGFVLRCFQHLSIPNIATLQCSWRHNRCTRGLSNTVLSYQCQIFSIFLRPQQIETELSCDVLNPARVPL